MKKKQVDKPVLSWETLNTTREEDGILNSKYLTERAQVVFPKLTTETRRTRRQI
jgi:hypothetical protein